MAGLLVFGLALSQVLLVSSQEYISGLPNFHAPQPVQPFFLNVAPQPADYKFRSQQPSQPHPRTQHLHQLRDQEEARKVQNYNKQRVFPTEAPEPLPTPPPVTTTQKPVRHHVRTSFSEESPFTTTKGSTQSQEEIEKIARQQAESARYSFGAAISDTINDHMIIRQETRDGLKLTGSYSYSDGFFKRTVEYVADENGYRVIRDEKEEIGDGPKVDLNGKVNFSSEVDGRAFGYSVTADDIPSLSNRFSSPDIDIRHGTPGARHLTRPQASAHPQQHTFSHQSAN